jgi:twitching motility protein PilT
MAALDALLVALKEQKGSDLHLVAGAVPKMRARGSITPIAGWPVLTDAALLQMLQELPPPHQWQQYTREFDLDFAYGLAGVGRFRANYFRQQKGAAAVFRIIPEKIIPLDELKVPPAVEAFAHLHQGLVLVTGPTGSGKSTTLAGVIDKVNATYAKHIVTIEDPIEFVHVSKRCVITQREVKRDSKSFASALRSAIRQDADVILVGEMRDYETISLALTAAEMGALVFGTLHTNSAAKTIDRLIDVFPADEQAQARHTLSESLQGIVSQLLLKTADGKGRCAVNEILVRTSGLPNLIREGNTPMMVSMMQSGQAQGMQLMDDALMKLVNEGRIKAEDAVMKALNKPRFEKLIKSGAAPAH